LYVLVTREGPPFLSLAHYLSAGLCKLVQPRFQPCLIFSLFPAVVRFRSFILKAEVKINFPRTRPIAPLFRNLAWSPGDLSSPPFWNQSRLWFFSESVFSFSSSGTSPLPTHPTSLGREVNTKSIPLSSAPFPSLKRHSPKFTTKATGLSHHLVPIMLSPFP